MVNSKYRALNSSWLTIISLNLMSVSLKGCLLHFFFAFFKCTNSLLWFTEHVLPCQTPVRLRAFLKTSRPRVTHPLPACGVKRGSDEPPPPSPPTSRRDGAGSAPGWDWLPAPVIEEPVRQDSQIWTGWYQFVAHDSAPDYISSLVGLLLRMKGKVAAV